MSAGELLLLNCGAGKDIWGSLGYLGGKTSHPHRRSILNICWKDWCWSWSSNTLSIWCQELTCWKRPWCSKRLRARGEGCNRGWNGWMVSLTQWIWVWANSGRLWRTGKPGVLQSMEPQSWTRLSNWPTTTVKICTYFYVYANCEIITIIEYRSISTHSIFSCVCGENT